MPVGRSLVEDDKLDEAQRIMSLAQARGVQLQLPVDHVVADAIRPDAGTAVLTVADPGIGDRMGLDIGPASAHVFADLLADAQTVLWNGPMGVFEMAPFAAGTMAVARACARVHGTTIIGGGDSVAAVKAAGVSDRITHISTGGGAALEFRGHPARSSLSTWARRCAPLSSPATGRCTRRCASRQLWRRRWSPVPAP
jgi:phosphoglycerate kinase